MLTSVNDVLVRLSILLLLYDCATCLIIPEELPTILSLIYSNIPPIKKGTDSRVGVGFRLGEHADVQFLVELGPQSETQPIGTADAKRRRDIMLDAAMRGELGPFAQAVAKYQIERKIQKEIEKYKQMEEKLKNVPTQEGEDKKTVGSEWLTKWSKEIQSSENRASLQKLPAEKFSSASTDRKTVQQRIGKPSKEPIIQRDKIGDLTKLYKLQVERQKE